MLHPVTAPTGRPLVAAVTGTNGKTSVSTATLQLMRAIGWPAAASAMALRLKDSRTGSMARTTDASATRYPARRPAKP